jgi:hypothetical protein|tara:strand:+ start:727 stop:867 length:141 start_codon:yes stop_codon:yes gene_type:complete
MPKRTVQTRMIVKTPKGLMLVDKDGNETPLIEKKKSEKKVDTTKKK